MNIGDTVYYYADKHDSGTRGVIVSFLNSDRVMVRWEDDADLDCHWTDDLVVVK